MTKSKPSIQPNVTYRVANPKGIPAVFNGDRIPIFRQMVDGEMQTWFEGDIYTGPAPAEPLRRGFIVEVPVGEA